LSLSVCFVFVFVCLFVCLFLFLFVCLFLFLFVYLFVFVICCLCFSGCLLYVCLFVIVFMYFSVIVTICFCYSYFVFLYRVRLLRFENLLFLAQRCCASVLFSCVFDALAKNVILGTCYEIYYFEMNFGNFFYLVYNGEISVSFRSLISTSIRKMKMTILVGNCVRNSFCSNNFSPTKIV